MCRSGRSLVLEATDGAQRVPDDWYGVVEHARMDHRVHTTGEIVRLVQAAGFSDVELAGRRRHERVRARLLAVDRRRLCLR
jgi:hypothetical protein